MAHQHEHRLSDSRVSVKLGIATAATCLLVVAELIAGWNAGSLSLIGDALHNFTDAIALLVALVALRLEKRPATDEKSFGYQRAGILAAFINAGTLVGLTIVLIVEAVDRFRHPQPVATREMLVVAVIALVINSVITASLHREGKHDVNIRSAVVHMFGDALSSVGIIIAAILITTTRSTQWDPAVSLAIAALIFWSSWGILRETMNLLLDGTPVGIDPIAVARALGAIEGVEGVHHLHIWALGPSRPALSCHLMVGDVPLRTTASLLEQVTEMLNTNYRIVHTTVQFEFVACADDDRNCLPYTAAGT